MQNTILWRPARPFWAAVALLAFCWIAISACSLPFPDGGAFSSSSYRLLARSSRAMSQISSVHLTFQMSSTTQLTPAVVPGAPLDKLPLMTRTPQDEHVLITGKGDEVRSQQGQEQLHLMVTPPSGQPLQIVEDSSHQQLFLQQGAQGQWVEVDSDPLPMAQALVQALFAQPLDQRNARALAQRLQIRDLGQKTEDGQTLHHLSIAFDTADLNLLLDASHPATPQEQQVRAALQQALHEANGNGTLDLGIDEETGLIHRAKLHVKAQGAAVPSGSQDRPPVILNSTFDASIDFRNFNQKVSIHMPTPVRKAQLPALALNLFDGRELE